MKLHSAWNHQATIQKNPSKGDLWSLHDHCTPFWKSSFLTTRACCFASSFERTHTSENWICSGKPTTKPQKKSPPPKKTQTKKPTNQTFTKLNVKKMKIYMSAWKCYLFRQSWGYSHAYNHVHWCGLTNQAVLPAWEVWHGCAYGDNCWHVQEFLLAAGQRPVVLAVVSLKYPEITRVNCHLSSQSCY